MADFYIRNTEKYRLHKCRYTISSVNFMRQNAASDLVLHYLLTECTFETWMELFITTQQPSNSTWILPIAKGGKFHRRTFMKSNNIRCQCSHKLAVGWILIMRHYIS